MSNFIGTQVLGLRMPIVKSGDDVKKIICNELKTGIINEDIKIQENDVIAITESLIARAHNNYVTVDDIANFIRLKYGERPIVGILWPIYSRNRFSIILKGIARACRRVVVQLHHGKDEVGNDIINPWTGVDIIDFYREVITDEGAEACIIQSNNAWDIVGASTGNIIIGTIHDRDKDLRDILNYLSWNDKTEVFDKIIRLSDIFNTPSGNRGWCEYGLLGSNKCGDERLKLFPTRESCEEVCEFIRQWVKDSTGKDVHVMVYGDGCFKDPAAGIWEFADPVSCPYHTGELLDKSPNELKIKFIADEVTDDSKNIKTLIKEKHEHIGKNKMLAQGTTPRKYYDLLASLCDLTSGSGDKGTPVILVQNYFKNYAD